jgi:hypothetical protein
LCAVWSGSSNGTELMGDATLVLLVLTSNERPTFCPPVCLEAAYALYISQYGCCQHAITARTQHRAVLVRPDVSEFDDACAAKVRFHAWREMILWMHRRNAHFTSLITHGPCIRLASRDGQNRLSMGRNDNRAQGRSDIRGCYRDNQRGELTQKEETDSDSGPC